MAQNIEVELPGDIQFEVDGAKITMSGKKGTLSREFKNPHTSFVKKDSVLVISTTSKRKRDIACLGTLRAHIKNMVKGVSGGVSYEMKIVYSHFPMSVKVEGTDVVIDNFLGEKSPRRAAILEGVLVEVKGHDIKVSGLDKDLVSQTAANIEQATRIRDLDPRVFQDGIYITVKDGRPIK